tara:strand:+ start:192 stop:500 length:309 start_codon:yes stop_codon:yes gene_type:complete
MKLTKSQLKRIIKEELEAVVETKLPGGPEVDIQDAIDMLLGYEHPHLLKQIVENAIKMLEVEEEEDTTGTIVHIINRFGEALIKLSPGQRGTQNRPVDGDIQ